MSGPPALRALLITELEEIGEIEDEWRALAVSRGNAFVTPEWVRAWWSVQDQESASLRIIAVRSPDGLLGVLPLALDTSRRPHALRFAGAGLGDRFHPVAAPEDEAVVAAAAVDPGCGDLTRRMVLFEHIDPGREWVQAMRGAAPRRLAVNWQASTQLPYISLKGLDWETYVAQRSKKFRSELRRRERMREEQLDARLATKESLESDLDELFRLHALRWGGQRVSVLTQPRTQAVLRAFAAAAMRQDWLRLHVLEADGSAVAAMLAWRVGNSYAFYNSGFDPAWSSKSIGTVLTSVAIRQAIEEQADEFDFLLGGEAYKRRFTPDSRPAANAVLTPAFRPISLLVKTENRVRALGRKVAGKPILRGVSRRARRALPTERS